MVRGVFLTEEEVDKLNDLLDEVDIEVGVICNRRHEPEDVLTGVGVISTYLGKINALLGRP